MRCMLQHRSTFFKTYYGRVDAINSILAVGGMDRKSRRKTFRVTSFYILFVSQSIFEYGVARLDRLVFYNAYAIWREKMGEDGVNLQDPRYSFKAATLECTREFVRRAMCEEISKKPRNAELARKRSTVLP